MSQSFSTTADKLTLLCIDCRHTYANTNSLSLSLLFDFSQCPSPLLPCFLTGLQGFCQILSAVFLHSPLHSHFHSSNSLFLPFFTAAEQCGSVAMATSHSVFSHPPYFTHPSTLTHSLFSLQSGRTIKICQQDSIKRVAAGGGMGTSETGRRKTGTGRPAKLKGYLFASERDRHMLSVA